MRWKAELYAWLRLLRAAQRPNQDFESFREMKKGRGIWQRNLGRRCHRVPFDARFSVLQRPRQMMNLAAVYLLLMHCVETIARSKKILERSFVADARRSNRPIAANEFSGVVQGRTASSAQRAKRACVPA